jgi:hypothetical protein
MASIKVRAVSKNIAQVCKRRVYVLAQHATPFKGSSPCGSATCPAHSVVLPGIGVRTDPAYLRFRDAVFDGVFFTGGPPGISFDFCHQQHRRTAHPVRPGGTPRRMRALGAGVRKKESE